MRSRSVVSLERRSEKSSRGNGDERSQRKPHAPPASPRGGYAECPSFFNTWQKQRAAQTKEQCLVKEVPFGSTLSFRDPGPWILFP